MNVLMIRPDAVLVEKDEIPIQKMFESLGIKCIKVSFKINSINYRNRHLFDTQTHLAEDSTAGRLMSDEKVVHFNLKVFKNFKVS